jgi:hypothetical protein
MKLVLDRLPMGESLNWGRELVKPVATGAQ